MTIDEAILHAEEVAKEHERHLKIYENIDEDRPLFKEEENECKKCANEHRQLAEWLKDYKRLKNQTEITWVAGADGAKVAFWDVPIPKVLKICEILQEPTMTVQKEKTCDGCLFQQYPRITICQECSRYYSDNYVKE